MALIDINLGPIIDISIGLNNRTPVVVKDWDIWAVESKLTPVVSKSADTWSVEAPTPDSFMIVPAQTGYLHVRKVQTAGTTYRVWLGTDPENAPDFVFVNPPTSDSENPMTTLAKIIQKEFSR